MKKSQLRKAIKEALQSLLQDQFVPVGGNYRCCQATTCPTYGNHTIYAQLEIGGQVPQNGDLFKLDSFSSQVPGSQPTYVYSIDMCFPASFTANPGYSGGCMLDYNPASLGNGCASLQTSGGPGNQGAGTTPCSAMTTPIAANFSANVQAHGWETTFTCLVAANNNPCSLLREKIRRWIDKAQNVGPQQAITLNQKAQFALNLGNTEHNCDNLQNLSPGSPNTLTIGGNTWDETAWTTQFTNDLNNAPWFNNPGQPCQFLNNKISQWQSQYNNLNWSVAQKDMLLAKIDVAEDLAQQNNCP